MLRSLDLSCLERGAAVMFALLANRPRLLRLRLGAGARRRRMGWPVHGAGCRRCTRRPMPFDRPPGRWLRRGAGCRAGCRPCRVQAVPSRIFGGLLLELGLSLRAALVSARFVEGDLTRPQLVERLAPFGLGLVETRRHDEMIPALALAADEIRLHRSALPGDLLAFVGRRRGRCARRCRHHRLRCRNSTQGSCAGQEKQCGQRAESRQRQDEERQGHQVSVVSTMRRASARYSFERISRNRETVRGNS